MLYFNMHCKQTEKRATEVIGKPGIVCAPMSVVKVSVPLPPSRLNECLVIGNLLFCKLKSLPESIVYQPSSFVLL